MRGVKSEGYAVAYEFPWFPFLHNLRYAEEAKKAVAAAILQALPEGGFRGQATIWWPELQQSGPYELFHERLPHPDFPASAAPVPFLPPERFFCTTGRLGNKDFCRWANSCDLRRPFVEKFAGAEEAVEQFRGELMDVLSPICMMTVKDWEEVPIPTDVSRTRRCTRAARDFLTEAGLRHGVVVEEEKFQRLIQQLSAGGGARSSPIVLRHPLAPQELRWHLGEEALSAARLVTFASWLRGDSPLAFRLRGLAGSVRSTDRGEHLLGVEPIDLQWHAPGEVFLDRLSRVISSVETRASQPLGRALERGLLEGDLPPNKKQQLGHKCFVAFLRGRHEQALGVSTLSPAAAPDTSRRYGRARTSAKLAASTRNDVVVNMDLVKRLQQGLLSVERYEEVLKTQFGLWGQRGDRAGATRAAMGSGASMQKAGCRSPSKQGHEIFQKCDESHELDLSTSTMLPAAAPRVTHGVREQRAALPGERLFGGGMGG
ncbi:unnamed protein product [Durusdinium trenchii]|uniref:Uncharacterized protein n=1 Tax=Durusdinium trenchii TaxID=1381693 RepID=A0ABP0PZD9_9DINO